MTKLAELLDQCSHHHERLCPRQVLGVRMGMLAGEVLGLSLPQHDRRLVTIMETDGCAADGVAVATNCSVGRRTMRIEDAGKVAATFVDTKDRRVVRITPRASVRLRARELVPDATSPWEAMLLGYQRMRDEQLLRVQPVHLCIPFEELVGVAGHRVLCDRCGEEIMNGREIVRGHARLCRQCSGQSYFSPASLLTDSP